MVNGDRNFDRMLGARLRKAREQRGLSAREVEKTSGGRFRATSIRLWERGDLSPKAEKLLALADFYGVSATELVAEMATAPAPSAPNRVVIDLLKLHELEAPDARRFRHYVADIQRQRFDYNGRMLSIRSDDILRLALIYDFSPDEVLRQLQEWDVLWRGEAR